MGFLSKAFKKVKKQIQPNNMMIGNMRKMPRRPGMISDMRFRGKMPRGGGFGNLGEAIRRLKEQRGGDMGMPRMDFGDQIGYTRPNKDPSMPIAFDDPSFRMIGTPQPIPEQMPRIDDGRMRAMPIRNEDGTIMSSRLKMPQPIPERMPIDPSSYYNPTIFGQQIGNMDFSQMPEISPIDMSNLQMPTLPREISQMDLPQMPEGLPSMQDVQGGRDLQQDFPTQRRMMMAEGDEVINRSPEQEIFSLQAQLENLEEQLRMDRSYNDDQAVIDTSAQMAAIQNRIKELLQESGQTISNTDRLNESGTSISRERQELLQRAQLSGGGDFPDLTGDGQVTQADILKGRGVYAEGDEVMLSIEQKINNELKARGYPMDVIADLTPRERLEDVIRQNDGSLTPKEIAMYASANPKNYMPQTLKGLTRKYAEGGEIEAMLSGMDSGEEEAMGELEQMAPEMEMIDQLVNMVVQMIQQGASEEEVIMFLREQGLDDEDIGTVLQLVSEMAETEEAAAQNEIGADLEQLG